jgi:hypothetical protein
MSLWLPILPIKRTEMNELAVVERAANWRRLKALVLDSVSSPITKRVYNLAWTSSSPGTNWSRGPASPRPP